MVTACRCKHCRKVFHPRPQNPDQQYCSDSACQRARKRVWQRQKLRRDPDYQANQRAARHCWQENNPDYWREYRRRNPEYVARNRERQRERNRCRRERDPDPVAIAKMDASRPERAINPGRYLLHRVVDGQVAKMDASIVEINVIFSG